MTEPHPFALTMLTKCCAEVGLALPWDAWWSRFHEHLPPGTLAAVEGAVSGGAVNVEGWRFRFRRGGSVYQFFSRVSEPAPNWEAFVHVALYGDLAHRVEPLGYLVYGERQSLDITVDGHDGSHVWYLEVKETFSALPGLAGRIAAFGRDGVPEGPLGRNDALSKAQDLVEFQPPWFSLAAIGGRLDFAVHYGATRTFVLIPDLANPPGGW
jgi:hypothetical protein